MPLNKSQLAAKQPRIGKLVYAFQQEMKLSQKKFAAELGVTFPTVNRWENGRAIPSLARQRIDFLLHQIRRGEVLRSKCVLVEEWRDD